MIPIPVIAVFDIGKTNKKLFLFDEQYKIVYERSVRLAETIDEDGDACEDMDKLQAWMMESLQEALNQKQFFIKAINFSAYGASFVFLDTKGKPVAPLYNYLKPFPESFKEEFYSKYGGEAEFSIRTASPVLGHLNSGMQLYRIKYTKPELFEQVKYALHLPQYLSYLFTGDFYSDITSLGCHTNLWDFSKADYHEWVYREGIHEKLAPVAPGDKTYATSFTHDNYKVGIGLHDSSAALIPYLKMFDEPFVLISTGTWCISLNPFNNSLLTDEELKQDCLCYISYEGKPVKASRLFAGREHEEQVKRLAAHFNEEEEYYTTVQLDLDLLPNELSAPVVPQHIRDRDATTLKKSFFSQRDLLDYSSYEHAYHHLIFDIIVQQRKSTQLVLKGTDVRKIFVDGGFSKNPIYMHLLARAFPDVAVFATSMAEATALGAAIAIHSSWNENDIPNHIIELKSYKVTQLK